MEKRHKKSKRSLRGEDVYELACQYDVGWVKSKKRKNGTKQSEENDDSSQDSGKRKKQCESPHVKTEDEVLLNNSKTLNTSGLKRKRKLPKAGVSAEQDLDPLHSKWTFTRKELGELKSKGVKVKLGAWSKKEINNLEANMSNYLKENNIADPTPLILAENGRRAKGVKMQSSTSSFYQCLGKGINRPLFHIYRRVLRMYNPENHVGRWSESDSDALLRFHQLYGDQWTRIGGFLGRSGMSVHHRYLELQRTHAGHWSEEEVGQLDAAVRASTGTEFGSQIYGEINWGEVADFVITRTAEQCRKKWMSEVCWKTADGEKNIKWNLEDDVKLIERLYAADESDENDINWALLTKDLPNSPSVTWLRSKWSTLKKAVPNYTECDFEEILDYLYNTHREILKTNTPQ